jgi:hypothetical protein
MGLFVRHQNPVTGSVRVWREGEHDHVTLATALAVWHGETIVPMRFY